MDKFDLDFTRPPKDLGPATLPGVSADIRARLKARRRARKIFQNAIDQTELTQLQQNIKRWGWYPAIRNAMKRGVSIEVAIAAHAVKEAQ